MEVTNGLLTTLVRTKPLQRILAPMSSKISQLIILGESLGYDTNASILEDVMTCVEHLKGASEGLLDVAKRWIQKAGDKDFKDRMSSACDLLDMACSNVYLAASQLEADDWSKKARLGLFQACKEVLQGTLKVLLVADDEEVKKITRAAKSVREKVPSVGFGEGTAHTVSAFKELTSDVVLLCSLCTKRQNNLINQRQREMIIMGLDMLKKSIPFLSLALKASLKHPDNPQAKTSKEFSVNQILTATKYIVDAMENNIMDDPLDLEEPGVFVNTLNNLMSVLSENSRLILAEDLEMWINVVIHHSMAVAHLCTDYHRDLVVKACLRILHVKGRIFHLYSILHENAEYFDVRNDFNEVCDLLLEEFCELEKHINMSVLHLIIDIFTETSEPLERLITCALSLKEQPNERRHCVAEDFQTLIAEFHAHLDNICHIARFAAASSTDVRRIRKIRISVSHMERLDPEILAAIMMAKKNAGSKENKEHLKLLAKEWDGEIRNLLQVLDDMTDPRFFLLISEKKLNEDFMICKGLAMEHETSDLPCPFKNMMGHMKRVIQVLMHILDVNPDPIQRSYLWRFITKAQYELTEVKREHDMFIRGGSSVSNFCAALSSVVDSAQHARQAFIGQSSGMPNQGISGKSVEGNLPTASCFPSLTHSGGYRQ